MLGSTHKNFHDSLTDWYAANGRQDLPWRQTKDPYKIYLSEVMLQQTQVQTVLDRFYFPFLRAFPTLQALAAAPEEAVMKQWQGLGYYSRARNLHRAAKLLSPHPLPAGEGTRPNLSHGERSQSAKTISGEGELPNTYNELIALPGIGRNTAHAILAFAFHQPYPVLEANVKRVLHRIFAVKERNDKVLWQAAEQLLDRESPFDYNQAMMDLGALVCLPKAPCCEVCPAAVICEGKKNPLAYPKPKSRKQPPIRSKRLIALRDMNGRYYLTPRTSRFLGGLYGFIELDENASTVSHPGRVSDPGSIDPGSSPGCALRVADMIPLGHITQTYSHFQLQAELLLAEWPHAMNGPEWFTLEEISDLPLSKADEKLLALLPRS